jgi:hypothetical protein
MRSVSLNWQNRQFVDIVAFGKVLQGNVKGAARKIQNIMNSTHWTHLAFLNGWIRPLDHGEQIGEPRIQLRSNSGLLVYI